MSKILEHNTIADLPIIALILFMSVFVIITIRVLRTRGDDPELAYLASLPLSDDMPPPSETTPTQSEDPNA